MYFSLKVDFLWFVFTEENYIYAHAAAGTGEKILYSSVVHDVILGALNQILDTFATLAENFVKEMAQSIFSPVTNTQDLSWEHFIL